MTNIENECAFHWETLLDHKPDIDTLDRIAMEIEFFIGHILPSHKDRGWTMHTDGVSIYTNSKADADRMASILRHVAESDISEWENEDGAFWRIDWSYLPGISVI